MKKSVSIAAIRGRVGPIKVINPVVEFRKEMTQRRKEYAQQTQQSVAEAAAGTARKAEENSTRNREMAQDIRDFKAQQERLIGNLFDAPASTVKAKASGEIADSKTQRVSESKALWNAMVEAKKAQKEANWKMEQEKQGVQKLDAFVGMFHDSARWITYRTMDQEIERAIASVPMPPVTIGT